MSLTSMEDLLVGRHEPAGRTSGLRIYQRAGKRVFDLVLLFLLAPFVLPLLGALLITVAIGGGKPLYRQRRVGRDGLEFQCYKIRTMAINADEMLKRLLSENPMLAEEWARDQKLALDPRVTSIGRFLRKTSLDELPQLWNVLTGEMSFVGARPFTPKQKELYDACASGRDYYQNRPGMSGLWQVGCRNNGDFSRRVQKDQEYFQNMGFFADLTIVLRTVDTVFRATGR